MKMEMIRLPELRTIHKDNYEECLRLKASVENADFVETVTYSKHGCFMRILNHLQSMRTMK